MSRIEHPTLSYQPNMSVNCQIRGALAPELKAFDRKIGPLRVNKWTYRFLRPLVSAMVPKTDTSGMSVRLEPKAGRGARVVIPDEIKGNGAVFMIHGGGYVMGTNKEAVINAAEFARQLGVPVICPSYSLAPEAPFPAAHNDLMAAWHWLQDNAVHMGIDPTKIVVGGISAGGGLAAALVQRILDEGGIQPAGQLLLYPMLDDRTAVRSEINKPRHRGWCNNNNHFGWRSYLGHGPGAATTKPYAVPARREELSGLPPAWIGVGTLDVFLDENRAYAERLTNAGIDVTYVESEGGIHGFDMAGTAMGEVFTATQIEFMRPLVN